MQQVLEGIDWLKEWQFLIDWLKEWQFLIGSMIILFAGAITAQRINQQIKKRDLETEDRRRRLVRALRASLPDDLEAIGSYIRRSADASRRAVMFISAKEEGRHDGTKRKYRRNCPTLPSHVLENLKVLIENLDQANARQLAGLVESYHIQHERLAAALNNFSRLRLDNISVPAEINFNPVFKHTLELYLRTKAVLPFARGETDQVSVSFGSPQVLDALKDLEIDPVMSPEAREHCVRFLSAA
jgi:hypothetical protein